MVNCRTFTDYLVDCPESIKVNALLEPATQYQWVIKDKFGNEHAGTGFSDGNGFLSIDVDDLPAGLLTSYSGDFTLFLYKYPNLGQPISFKIADYYDAICFNIKPGNRIKSELGVGFDCVAPGGGNGNSAVFPFSSVANLHIDWNSLLTSLYGNAPLVPP